MERGQCRQWTLFFFLFIIFSSIQLEAKRTEKTRVIEKEFNVDSDAKVMIDNRFGKVHINTWDQNRVMLKVEIRVEDSNEERARERLEAIEIELAISKDLVSATTHISDSGSSSWKFWEWNWDGDSHNIRINYTIYMPATNDLYVVNKYGDTFVDDLLGNAELHAKYGNLDVEKLSGDDNEIYVGYGGADIEFMEQGMIEVKYGSLELDRATSLELESKYSDVDIDVVGALDLEMKYGNIDIEELYSLDADIKYTSLEIGELLYSAEIDAAYGSALKIDYVDKDFEEIDIDASYINVVIGIDADADYRIDAEASYGNIDCDISKYKFESWEDGNDQNLEAKVGKGRARIDVDVSYGNVRFKEN